jgi:5-hydroxyisourate hydrolase
MTIVAQVFDGAYGRPAAGVRAYLRRGDGATWTTITEVETDDAGQVSEWDGGRLEHGLYRLVFDSYSYFANLGASSAYPEVTVTFRVGSGPMKVLVQVLLVLSPYSYSTYCGTVDG